MDNVIEFVKWGLTHVKRNTIPQNAILPLEREKCGVEPWEYLWGTNGHKATQYLIDSRFESYYERNGWTRSEYDAVTKGWVERKQIVSDCQGVEDAFSHSQTNANGNYVRYCTDKGLCSKITRKYVIGEAVFNGSDSKKTHIGWVCGFLPDGDILVMEERGLAYGFVVTRMSQRAWKYRGLMTKRYIYDQSAVQPDHTGKPIFKRVLKYGSRGDDVIELKKLLINAGYSKGITVNTKASGNFYGNTREAVKAYQRDNGLTIDGKAGKNTITALGGVWNG